MTQLNKSKLLLIGVILIGAYLRLYILPELMPFIGDQGWFYISARDMLLTGNIPLTGIASSHPWLHQGPFWTYILGIIVSRIPYHTSLIPLLTLFYVYFLYKWVKGNVHYFPLAILMLSILYN